MAASYLVKKADTYYFRHSLPQSARKVFGKREFIKTLQVNRKSEAVRLSRELKIVFDLIMKKSEKGSPKDVVIHFFRCWKIQPNFVIILKK